VPSVGDSVLAADTAMMNREIRDGRWLCTSDREAVALNQNVHKLPCGVIRVLPLRSASEFVNQDREEIPNHRRGDVITLQEVEQRVTTEACQSA
jgi:hypothetical protein